MSKIINMERLWRNSAYNFSHLLQVFFPGPILDPLITSSEYLCLYFLMKHFMKYQRPWGCTFLQNKMYMVTIQYSSLFLGPGLVVTLLSHTGACCHNVKVCSKNLVKPVEMLFYLYSFILFIIFCSLDLNTEIYF